MVCNHRHMALRYGSPEEVWEEEVEEEQEWYEESPEPEPLSPATKKRIDMQAMHRRRVEGNSVQHVLATCIY